MRLQGEPWVLLEDRKGGGAWLFHQLVREEHVAAPEPGALRAALERIDQSTRREGLHAAGWLGYEAGFGLLPKLAALALPPPAVPALWFGLYRRREALAPAEAEARLRDAAAPGGFAVRGLRPNMDAAAYRSALARIQARIAAGDTYQVNYTLKQTFALDGAPAALYLALRERQATALSAFVQTAGHSVLSLSPELFFRKQGGRLTLRPMKGTAPRGATPEEDEAWAARLRLDEKSRAENLMIVDLIRSDVGRIARIGTVRVPALFEVERYATLHQMVSVVEAEVDPELSLAVLMASLFPSGSVTGAPKLRTMELIHQLEREPRGVYTGAIGFVSPDGDACFNVAIRTIVVDAGGRGEMGIGSGVVADSDSDAEYRECLLKGEFLAAAARG